LGLFLDFLFYKKILGFLKDVYDDDEGGKRGRKKMKKSSIKLSVGGSILDTIDPMVSVLKKKIEWLRLKKVVISMVDRSQC
jgi:hypothetical protein